jgi:hypothetical protein
MCSASGPSVLVSGQQTPIGIVVDETNVYWMNLAAPGEASASTSQLMKCAKAGCGNAPTALASGAWNRTTRLALSNGTIYWATDNLVLACPTSGCPGGPTVISSAPLQPSDIAVGPQGIYLGDSIQQALLMYPLTGSMNPTVLWSASTAPTAVAVGGTTVYFAIAGVSLLSCGATACSPIVVGGMPTAIEAEGNDVFIGTQASQSPGALGWCPQAGCSSGLTFLTTRLGYCAGIAADATNVYFTDQGASDSDGGPPFVGSGRVAKCPIAGCQGKPTPLAGFVTFPQQIAVDSTTVYWTDFGSIANPNASSDGRVMTAPK